MHCTQCGSPLPDNSKFCTVCGKPVAQSAPVTEAPAQPAPAMQEPPVTQPAPPVTQPAPPVMQAPPVTPASSPRPQQGYAPYQQQAQYGPGPGVPIAPAPAKKKSPLPFILIGVGVLIVAVAAFLLLGKPAAADLPQVTYTYLEKAAEPTLSYKAVDTISPSLYRSLSSILTFTGSVEDGERNVMLHVEIPGFTQAYEQKVTLTRQLTKIDVRPPLLTGDLDLSTEKDAQLVISVTDMDSSKVLLKDSKTVKILSKYDAVWWTPEEGDSNTDNILAWMTPESDQVLELKREAVDYLSYISNGQANAIVGYQDYGIWKDPKWNTWAQAVAIQGAMSDIAKVRYNNAAFSISSDSQQRVMLPEDVMKSQSGICIETSLLMASALESAGMHVMLIFPPGHAQVAVETWPDSGEYFLIETTTLPMDMTEDAWDRTVMYLTPDQWQGYIDGTANYSLGKCYVLDCDLAKKLSILPMSN